MDVTSELLLRIGAFALLGVVTGFLSGLFGIGGGIVRIPLFIFLFPLLGVAHEVLMHVAIGTSVALVVPTAIVATRKQINLGNLDVAYYKTWAIGVFIGVLIGMSLLPLVSTEVLKWIFVVFLLVVGCYVGFVKETVVIAKQPPDGSAKLMVSSAIGCCAALTGTGGGALTTPTVKAFGYPLHRAIALASASGLVIGSVGTVSVIAQGWNAAGRPSSCLGYIDVVIFLAMLPTTLIATPLGTGVSNSMNKSWLRRIYTVLIFLIAADMIWKLVG